MLARHAEDMFWAGRYLERAEDTARMVRATLMSTVAESPAQSIDRMQNLVHTLRLDVPEIGQNTQQVAAQITDAPPLLRSPAGLGLDVQATATRLVSSPALVGSVVFCIGRARENLRSLRDQIPSELWEQINQFHLQLRQSSSSQSNLSQSNLSQRHLSQGSFAQGNFAQMMELDPFGTLDQVRVNCQTLVGIIDSTMPQGEGYRFLMLGLMLERAVMTSRLLMVRYPELDGSSYDEMALTLRSVSALEAYQRASQSSPHPADVVRFLLLSPSFPRSVLYCLQACESQLRAIADDTSSLPGQVLGRLRSRLEFADLEELMSDLPRYLQDLESGIRDVADRISVAFFRHAEVVELHSQAIGPGIAP